MSLFNKSLHDNIFKLLFQASLDLSGNLKNSTSVPLF